MTINLKNRQAGWKHQKGFTLLELMIAGFISLIVTSGMVILMASTLGTGTQTIKMTQLSAEMRTAMQIMTRELRRANYHSGYATCFGDTGCLVTEAVDAKVREINIKKDFVPDGDCFSFYYDRPQRCPTPPCTAAEFVAAQKDLNNAASVGSVTYSDEDTLAAFRLDTVTDPDGTVIGVVQMARGFTGTVAADTCPLIADANWVNITNPGFVDIQSLEFDDSVAGLQSYVVTNDADLSVERIRITLTGRLRENDLSLPGFMRDTANAPTLAIQDFVRVRNDIVRP
ncbi:PilW family protein [Pseudomonadota bacterium]